MRAEHDRRRARPLRPWHRLDRRRRRPPAAAAGAGPPRWAHRRAHLRPRSRRRAARGPDAVGRRRRPATVRGPTTAVPRPSDGEVRVAGPRVLMHDGDAVLAVDERLRYGPLKAGYHGGAAPAEVVVPLHVLTPSEPPAGWAAGAPQTAVWWHSAVAPAVEPVDRARGAALSQLPEERCCRRSSTRSTRSPSARTSSRRSSRRRPTREQRKRAQRVTLTDDQIAPAAALWSLAGQPPRPSVQPRSRWASRSCSSAAPCRWPSDCSTSSGTRSSTATPTASTIVLDVDLLKEQFGVTRMSAVLSAPGGAARSSTRCAAAPCRTTAWTCSPSASTGSSRTRRRAGQRRSGGGAVFKAVRGEYGSGKTFFARWLAERAKRRGFAAAEVQISETETPLHRLETVYRRVCERWRPRSSRRRRSDRCSTPGCSRWRPRGRLPSTRWSRSGLADGLAAPRPRSPPRCAATGTRC